jgi:Single-strand binding protein family
MFRISDLECHTSVDGWANLSLPNWRSSVIHPASLPSKRIVSRLGMLSNRMADGIEVTSLRVAETAASESIAICWVLRVCISLPSGGASAARSVFYGNLFFANPPFDGYLRKSWGKVAQIAEKFVAKGTVVFVEGRLQTRKFENREGGTQTVTEVVVASLRVLGEAKNSSHSDNNSDGSVSSARDTESEAVPF